MKQLFKLQEKIDKLKLQRDKARAEVQRLRTVHITQDPPAEYTIKEMHIDCENSQGFEVGKWYKSKHGIIARFEGKEMGIRYYSLDWGNWHMYDFENWQLATPQEIEEVLTKRCKELGLFDGEFECLSSFKYTSSEKEGIEYWELDDKFWIGENIAYSKGKFAKLVDNKNIATTADIPESMFKLAVIYQDVFKFKHTQLSDKSRAYLSQFDNVVIE